MDLAKVLQQLHEELDNLDAAIISLERLEETGKLKRRAHELLNEVALPLKPGRKRKKSRGQESGGGG